MHMDKLMAESINIADTGISSNDLFNPELTKIALDLAKGSPRKRGIIRIHRELSDEKHLMMNAILGESYVPPHKHEGEGRTEIFRIVKGRAFIVLFDENGKVEDKIEMSDAPDGRKVVAVRSGRWHTYVPMSDETVILEAKRQPAGGYDSKMDKTMAPWAPPDGSEAGQKYLHNLVNRLQ